MPKTAGTPWHRVPRIQATTPAVRRVATQFALFTAMGAIGTMAHFLVLIGVVERMHRDAVIGSTAGFITDAVINYLLNYHVTFGSARRHLHAAPRFFAVAAAGMLLNALVMAVMSRAFALNYLACQVVATGLVLIWNFVANRLWTFGGRLPPHSHH